MILACEAPELSTERAEHLRRGPRKADTCRKLKILPRELRVSPTAICSTLRAGQHREPKSSARQALRWAKPLRRSLLKMPNCEEVKSVQYSENSICASRTFTKSVFELSNARPILRPRQTDFIRSLRAFTQTAERKRSRTSRKRRRVLSELRIFQSIESSSPAYSADAA